jgi:hypothetical protein
MELHVSEIDNLQNYEQIPENMPPKINVLKKASKVHFEDSQTQNQTQNIKPYVSGVKARMVRPNVPPPKPKISYDDILNKMGMFVAEGKLHLLDGQGSKQPLNQNQSQEKSPRQPLTNSHSFVNEEPNPHQNSYIYNKYFQNNNYQPEPQRPLTPLEYRDMLIRNIIQKQKIKQMKSTKLVMPNSNINFAPGPTANLNKLFGFSQR